MALPSAIHRFAIDVSDIDRGVYESLDLRVARHPSESVPYLLTRVIARALHTSDDVDFSKGGLSEADEPALSGRDLTGRRHLWIEVGSPSADRLHKASKATDRVVVYCHKEASLLAAAIIKGKVHKAEDIAIYGLDGAMLDGLGETLGRTNAWGLVRTEGQLFITVGDRSFESVITQEIIA